MKALISKNEVTIYGKIGEDSKIESIIDFMMHEIPSLCLIESFGSDRGFDKIESTLSYDSSDATVADVKASYSDAKKLSK